MGLSIVGTVKRLLDGLKRRPDPSVLLAREKFDLRFHLIGLVRLGVLVNYGVVRMVPFGYVTYDREVVEALHAALTLGADDVEDAP